MKITDRVYCRIGEQGTSNIGWILGDEYCTVVDTAMTPEETRQDLQAVGETTDKDIRFLINTHYHPDHTFGNMHFSEIIGHSFCYEKLKEMTPFYMEDAKNAQNKERFQEFFIKLPTLTFKERVTIHAEPDIEIIHQGGHTPGSAVVYIPEEKVLFSGDLLFAGYHPYMGDADINQWITALHALLSLEFKAIIPGHGEVCDKEEIKRHITYLQAFLDTMRDLKKKYSKETLLEKPYLLDLPQLGNEERIRRNIDAQYHKI
ncbi:MAG: MBL fold metallo-hydrolase [Theionarchaea archaeon]|nr:MBL fold metallo-hydrolase [Theionarchaea archaeon]MBU7000782.1 MBL fold metallo-hydrolase [Theionarchaea archaeon]MBU7021435.1 MBL fold metallo-hydrolase [Theionarchaea archaeon]MBU7033623.1 MBL fold metallo-hydrolase [Theionarchaea archaeon]MBU7041806.1 MBL fold metallo-hydrolase [Theionarchaea archaeon]